MYVKILFRIKDVSFKEIIHKFYIMSILYLFDTVLSSYQINYGLEGLIYRCRNGFLDADLIIRRVKARPMN